MSLLFLYHYNLNSDKTIIWTQARPTCGEILTRNKGDKTLNAKRGRRASQNKGLANASNNSQIFKRNVSDKCFIYQKDSDLINLPSKMKYHQPKKKLF